MPKSDKKRRSARILGVLFLILAAAILIASFAVGVESTRGVAVPVAMMFMIFSIVLLGKSREGGDKGEGDKDSHHPGAD